MLHEHWTNLSPASMTPDPIILTTKRRKRRVELTTRQIQKLSNRKRLLREAEQQILYERPQAVATVYPQSSEVKSCKILVEEYVTLISPRLSPSTIIDKRRSIKIFTDYLGPQNFNREVVERFVKDLHEIDWMPGTRWLVGQHVAAFLKFLWDSRRIDDDWCRGIKWPEKPAQQPRPIYTPEEVKALVELAGDRPVGFILLLAYNSGLAISDACNLLWKEIDLEKLIIKHARNKTGVEAIIPIKFGSALHAAIERQRQDSIAAFGQATGDYPVCRWSHNNKHSFYTLFKRLCAQAGIKYRSFHSFRATMATDLVNSSTPLNVSLKVLGLRSVNQLMAYATTPPESIRTHMEKLRA